MWTHPKVTDYISVCWDLGLCLSFVCVCRFAKFPSLAHLNVFLIICPQQAIEREREGEQHWGKQRLIPVEWGTCINAGLPGKIQINSRGLNLVPSSLSDASGMISVHRSKLSESRSHCQKLSVILKRTLIVNCSSVSAAWRDHTDPSCSSFPISYLDPIQKQIRISPQQTHWDVQWPSNDPDVCWMF